MTLSLSIAPNLQIGAVEIMDARPGAARRALQMAIEHNLFENGGPRDSPKALSFDVAVAAFWRELDHFHADNADLQAFWDVLFKPEKTPDAQRGKVEDRNPKDAAFCLSLHALCGALAAERIGWASNEDVDGEIDEIAGGDTDANSSAAEEQHIAGTTWTRRTSAVRAIAEHLRRSCRQQLKAISGSATVRDELANLVADVLLTCLLKVLGVWFECRQQGKGALRLIVLRDPEMAARLEGLLGAMPFRFTPQPLKEPVRYEIGAAASEVDGQDEEFQVDLIGYRRKNEFIRELHRGAIEEAHRAPAFRKYVQAVNMQMEVPWRINLPLLTVIRRLSALAVDRGAWDVEAAAAASDSGLGEAEISKLQAWVRDQLYRPQVEPNRKSYRRPGEFLDHVQARQVMDELSSETGENSNAAFYLPWKADYRGRIYAETPWLTPQGGDVQRGLLEFARGRPLDEAGLKALRRHGANLVKPERIVKDLHIEGRLVVSFEERERWILLNEHHIIASADAPLREAFWRERDVVKKPFQFLAFCQTYRQWTLDPMTPVYLPVQIDGTCNGMQHIAALTGDEQLARAVNVLPRADDLPGDIYGVLAGAAARTLGEPDIEKGLHKRGLKLGNIWLSKSACGSGLLDRETAKKVIMTIPYGASQGAQAANVLDRIADTIEREWRRKPKMEGLEELISWIDEKQNRQKFVRICTHGQFGDLKTRARTGDVDAESELKQLTVLASYVALALVAHLRAALSRDFNSVDRFRAWLDGYASACAGLPLTWLSPLGFPVCQDKFELRGSSLNARLGNRPVRLDLTRLSMKVSRARQRNALLPNLIHSLDATHLAMTLLDAQHHNIRDIGTIHDCLLCHPNDAARLSEIVRGSFAQLYRHGATGASVPLPTWQQWMGMVSRIRQLKHASALLGMFDVDSEFASMVLAALAKTDPDARKALELKSEIEALPNPQAWLALQLVIFMRDHYVPPKNESPANGTSTGIKPLDTAPLPLDGGRNMSPYFFS